MNSLQIKCFFTAAECLNFTKAASLLFISQATLSRNIAALESELDVTLFHRGSKSVQLLPAGNIMLDALRQAEADITQATKQARILNRNTTGALSIGSLDGQMLDHIMIEALREFQLQFKEAAIHMTRGGYRALTDALLSGSLDMVEMPLFNIRRLHRLRWETVCTMETLLIIPLNHPLAEKTDVRLSDFRKDVFITPDENESKVAVGMLRKVCIEAGFEPIIRVVPDISTQQLEIECGRGICAANKNHMMYNNPNVRGIRVPEFTPARFVLAWSEDNPNPLIPELVGLLSRTRQSSV